ncbi:MAG: hypothetical protein JSS53_05565, partial [Proteobacteria bacterium]|nr:hypothetical protein [Pseudomonadota bacterium]
LLQLKYQGNVLTGAKASNPGGANPPNEGPQNVVDGQLVTKWFDSNRRPLVLDFERSVLIDNYTWATANDCPYRDPISWRFEGSYDGNIWYLIDAKNNYAVPTTRHTFLPDLIPIELAKLKTLQADIDNVKQLLLSQIEQVRLDLTHERDIAVQSEKRLAAQLQTTTEKLLSQVEQVRLDLTHERDIAVQSEKRLAAQLQTITEKLPSQIEQLRQDLTHERETAEHSEKRLAAQLQITTEKLQDVQNELKNERTLRLTLLSTNPKLLDSAAQQGNSSLLISLLEQSIGEWTALSLVHFADDFNAHATELEKKSALLTLDDLMRASENYLQKNDWINRRYLKRLTNGVQQLLSAWKQNTLKNKVALDLLDQEALEECRTLFSNNQLNAETKKLYQLHLEQVGAEEIKGWLTHALPEARMEAYNAKVIQLLVKKSHDTDDAISIQLTKNGDSLLLKQFREGTLDKDIGDCIANLEDLSAELLLVQTKWTTALKAEVTNIMQVERTDKSSAIKQICMQWQDKTLSETLSNDLDGLVGNILFKTLRDLEKGVFYTQINYDSAFLFIQQYYEKRLELLTAVDFEEHVKLVIFNSQKPTAYQKEAALLKLLNAWKTNECKDDALVMEQLLRSWQLLLQRLNAALNPVYAPPFIAGVNHAPLSTATSSAFLSSEQTTLENHQKVL